MYSTIGPNSAVNQLNNAVFVSKNEKKLAERIGLVVILFGVETVLFPVVYQFLNGVEGYHFVVLAVLHILALFILMVIDQMEINCFDRCIKIDALLL